MTDIQLITTVVVVLLAVAAEYKRRLDLPGRAESVFTLLSGLARVAVDAAEEVGKATGAKGEDKYSYAVLALEEAARRAGVVLKDGEANMLIHKAVGVQREESAYIEAALAS